MVSALNGPDIQVFGVLDGLAQSEIRQPLTGNYPLKTRLSGGEEIETDCEFLQPRLQSLIDRNEADFVMHIVLSVAPFMALHAEGVLLRPFEHGCRALASRHIHEICVMVPYQEQVFHSRQKWETAGFSATVFCAEDRPREQPVEEWIGAGISDHAVQGIVIDFVGYSKSLTQRLEGALGLPVMDLGFEAMSFGQSVLEEFRGLELPSLQGRIVRTQASRIVRIRSRRMGRMSFSNQACCLNHR